MSEKIYFDPKFYLPYQRNFILVNSERTIGKTYSTQKFMIERGIAKGERFVYYVRVQDEKKSGVFEGAFQKVMMEQFPDMTFKFRGNQCYYIPDEDTQFLMGTCVALSEANKTKRINVPRSRWGFFDEYVLDALRASEYVSGWDEPILFLKSYHTIDREEDYQTVFMMGNNIEFYNPYHIHKAFNIPYTEKNQIWMSENVIFHNIEASKALKEKKQKSKFLNMIKDTSYGNYAVGGEYAQDSRSFIEKRKNTAKLKFVFEGNKQTYGCWWDVTRGLAYIDRKYDKNFRVWYTYDETTMDERKILIKGKEVFNAAWLGNMFKRGFVRWDSPETKKQSTDLIRRML